MIGWQDCPRQRMLQAGSFSQSRCADWTDLACFPPAANPGRSCRPCNDDRELIVRSQLSLDVRAFSVIPEAKVNGLAEPRRFGKPLGAVGVLQI